MKNFFHLLFLLLPSLLFAQTISGKIINEQDEPLIGASIYWLGTTMGTTTDEDGGFEISFTRTDSEKLVASYVGYISDTIEVKDQNFVEFKLAETQALDEVVVKGQRDGIITSNLSIIKTEQITQTELKKAACCDLAGCFSTQSSVYPQITNVLTNSKELRILGLSGVYNQVLIDGFPMIQGLSYTYGISSLPGTLVDNIFVSKGANSVLQGYESISGQINVITKDPSNTDQLFLNAYMNSFMEKHFNVNYAFKKGSWSNLTALHVVLPADKIDRDEDTFLDLPLLTRYMISNKWKYRNETEWGWSSSVGIRFLKEQRVGGQLNFNEQTDEGTTNAYGQTVNINQPEFWTKVGYRPNDNHNFVLFASGFYQNQQSFFGTVNYAAQQTNFYSNLQYELTYSTHLFKTGGSFRHLRLQEDITFMNNDLQRTYAGNYERLENIPGFFAENTMRFLEGKLTWIAGIRADHHNQFGMKISPRTLLKYDFTPNTVVRANIGKGWRTVNLFSENINLLVSSRDILFEEELQAEEAINYGVNFTQKFEANNQLSGYISADYYRTDFQNQIFPDYDSDPTKAIIKNFTGTSIGNGFQAEVYLNFLQRFEFKTGYNFLDVYRKESDLKQLLPFNARHKVLTTFSYQPLSRQYHFDASVHWLGQQRLPDTKSNPIEFQQPDFSEPYTTVNAQFTYNFKKMEVYAGCENIFDFRQERPIISWQNPFSPYFDTSSVWGPTRGREIYVGLRYVIADKSS